MAAIASTLLSESSDIAPEGAISLEEYLRTSYHADCDFVDGRLEGRNMGGTKHGLMQMELGFWFRSRRDEWNIRVISELRTRTGPTRVRLPDVSVVLNDHALDEELRVTPALIAIEILSPDDRMNRVIRRLGEFLSMGVAHVWLIDPVERVAYTLSPAGLRLVQETRLTIPHSPIYLDLPELFSGLD